MLALRLFPIAMMIIYLEASGDYSRGKRFMPWGGGGGFDQIDIGALLKALGGNNFNIRVIGPDGKEMGQGRGGGGGGRHGHGPPSGAGRNQFGEDKPEAPSSGGTGGDYHQAGLEATNDYRQKHGAAPLVLDAKLSQDCQAWAETLASSNNMRHSCSMCNEYGENLWMMSGRLLDPAEAAQKAVKSWYNEVKMYNWNNPVFSGSTGHFTALVWKGTRKMGIGLATNPRSKATYVVARYVPPGNMMGDFENNVGRLQ